MSELGVVFPLPLPLPHHRKNRRKRKRSARRHHTHPTVSSQSKNMHTETNKTPLRALIPRAFIGDTPVSSDRGMDSVCPILLRLCTQADAEAPKCHICLATRTHSRILHEYLSSQCLVQTHGLDDLGASPSSTQQQPMKVEMVRGKEEVYRERVRRKSDGSLGGKPWIWTSRRRMGGETSAQKHRKSILYTTYNHLNEAILPLNSQTLTQTHEVSEMAPT
jgi:xRRM domain